MAESTLSSAASMVVQEGTACQGVQVLDMEIEGGEHYVMNVPWPGYMTLEQKEAEAQWLKEMRSELKKNPRQLTEITVILDTKIYGKMIRLAVERDESVREMVNTACREFISRQKKASTS